MKSWKNPDLIFFKWPRLTAVLSGLVIFILCLFIIYLNRKQQQESVRSEMTSKSRIAERNIDVLLSEAKRIASIFSIRVDSAGKVAEFQYLAEKYIEGAPFISAIEICPNGVVAQVYPKNPNQKAIGFDILGSKKQQKGAYRAIKSKDIFFAGPLHLVQGGEAVVARYPVFNKSDKFWGFIAIIIKPEALIANTHLEKLAGSDFSFQMSKVDSSSNDEAFFYNETIDFKPQQTTKIYLEQGHWNLYLHSRNQKSLLYWASLIFAFMLSLSLGYTIYSVLIAPRTMAQELKRIEAEHRQLNSQLSTIFHGTQAAILLLEGRNLAIKRANQSFCKLVDCDRSKLAASVWDYFDEESRIQVLEIIETGLTENKAIDIDKKVKIYAASGKVKAAWMRLTKLESEGAEESFVLCLDDITELTKSERALRLANEKLNAYLQNSPLGVIEFDNKLKIVDWSGKSQEIFGWTKEEVLKTDLDIIKTVYEEDMQETLEITKDLLGGKVKGNTSHNRNIDKNGNIVHCVWHNSVFKDDDGKVLSIFCLVEDISESQEVIRQKEIQEERLKVFFDNTNDFLYLLRVEPNDTYRCIAANKRYFELTNSRAEEVINTTVSEKYTEERAAYLKERFGKIAREKKSITVEEEISDVDGKSIYIESAYTPVLDRNGNCINILCVARDTTERKTNEIALSESYELTKNQNHRLLNFAYIVSHNLRTHTSNISGILGLYKNAKTEDERNALLDYLNSVSESLEETMTHLNEVVSIQTTQQLQTAPLNLFDYIEKAILLLREKIKDKNADVVNQVDRSINIPHNPSYLESICLNFISNALKYSKSDVSPVIKLSTKLDAKYVHLHIKDNGLGIDLKKYGDTLFGMYKRFHQVDSGKGLGLFITKSQIEALHGKIDVESTVGEGTEFIISFLRELPVRNET